MQQKNIREWNWKKKKNEMFRNQIELIELWMKYGSVKTHAPYTAFPNYRTKNTKTGQAIHKSVCRQEQLALGMEKSYACDRCTYT